MFYSRCCSTCKWANLETNPCSRRNFTSYLHIDNVDEPGSDCPWYVAEDCWHDAIANKARKLWESEGKQQGKDQEYWYRALRSGWYD